MLRLPSVFLFSWYPLCTSVDNTNAMKLHLHLDIKIKNTGNYTFIQPRAQRVQRRVRSAALKPRSGHRPQTRLRQTAGFNLISGIQPVIVSYNNVEDDK